VPPENLTPKNVRSHDFNVRYDGVLRIVDDALDARVDVGSMPERSSSFAGSGTTLLLQQEGFLLPPQDSFV
jgi:hypothetical protein